LAELGFHPDPFSHKICRYKYKDIPVDIMLAIDSPLGPSNHWYQIGFKSLREIEVKSETILIFSAPCFLATKFEAFNNRGNDDYRTSHDFEDIIYVIDNRDNIVEEIASANSEVKLFLKAEIKKIINSTYCEEIITAHIQPSFQTERFSIIMDKLNRVIAAT
jgi:hypothetical protein